MISTERATIRAFLNSCALFRADSFVREPFQRGSLRCFSTSPFKLPDSRKSLLAADSAPIKSVDESNNETQRNDTKSVDDFPSPNIYSGIPFFSDVGMVTFKLSPALFKKNQRGDFAADFTGWLRLIFYPKSEEELTKFNTKKPVRLNIRAVDVGSILEIDAKKVDKPIIIQSQFGYLQVSPGSAEGMLKLKGIPKYKLPDTPEFVEVDITTGQFRTLQTVLTLASPSLFGWQVVADPRLLPRFMDRDSIDEEKQELQRAEKLSFFKN